MQQQISQCRDFLHDLQNRLCQQLEQLEASSAKFSVDDWSSSLGSGSTRVLRAELFEKAGVNFSQVQGQQLPAAASVNRQELAGKAFIALGVSTVSHPRNPKVPTSHANVRLFVVEPDSKQPQWWFGGGFDLTPYYPYPEDCQLWHQHASSACALLGPEVYQRFKKQCDDYFYLPHRQECRGIGGIFYDELNDYPFAQCLEFTQAVADNYLQAYASIVAERKDENYDANMRDYQLHRRGRYVEFNLLYDRGTLFGLQSRGRTESILMSLPKTVKWDYNWQPGQAEAQLVRDYFQPRDWLAAT